VLPIPVTNHVQNFFTTVKSLVAEAGTSNGHTNSTLDKLSLTDKDRLQSALENAETELRSALSDSFDTPKAMRVIYELIRDANIYINTHKADIEVRELEKVARWVTKIVGILGLDANASPPYDGLDWATTPLNRAINPQEAIAPYSGVYQNVRDEIGKLQVHSEVLDALVKFDADTEFSSLVSTGANDIETISVPYLHTVSRMRDELRRLAPTSPSKKQILSLSDRIRDEDLINLNVYLEDRPDGQPSLIKFVPKADLIAQREEKGAREREKVAQKEAARLSREKQEEERKEKAKASPVDMYKGDERFSEWDEEGMPVKMKSREEVPKSQLKKLRKDWERQKKLWEEYSK
jgi:cysteinyl-tRNA synthetase